MTIAQPGQEQRMEPFVSVTCGGERCHCGKPAVRKVGEEIPGDDPMPRRHNLTAYVCAEHYAELMGPMGAQQVGATRRPTADLGDDGKLERHARKMRESLNDELPNGVGNTIDALLDRLILYMEALVKCRDKFDFYEQCHRLKCTAEADEKADRNRELVEMIDAVLSRSAG